MSLQFSTKSVLLLVPTDFLKTYFNKLAVPFHALPKTLEHATTAQVYAWERLADGDQKGKEKGSRTFTNPTDR